MLGVMHKLELPRTLFVSSLDPFWAHFEGAATYKLLLTSAIDALAAVLGTLALV